jgi:uncharacterized protein (DUF302 family)
MSMIRILGILAVATLVACAPAPKPATVAHAVLYSKEAKFENVRDDLKAAIENRGLVIDHASFIHNMLERTGQDLGTTTPIFHDAQAFSFCSAVVSRKTMEADAHNIVFCPYTIVVYATIQEPAKVHVAYRIPQPVGSDASKAALKEVEALLDGIAREALGMK